MKMLFFGALLALSVLFPVREQRIYNNTPHAGKILVSVRYVPTTLFTDSERVRTRGMTFVIPGMLLFFMLFMTLDDMSRYRNYDPRYSEVTREVEKTQRLADGMLRDLGLAVRAFRR